MEHVAYEASGIGGKPSLLFDGSVYLKTAAAADLGVTAAGGAWFIVFKTPCTRAERINMGIMGSVPGQRFGAFFTNDGQEYARGFFFGDIGPIGVTSNATQIVSGMCWKEGSTSREYPMNLWTQGAVVSVNPSPGSAVFMVGNMIPSWMPTFEGDISEMRIYNAPLTATERALTEISLATHYGISVTTAGINGVPPSDHQHDACVFNGKFLDSPDLAPTNAVSGELTLACLDTIDQTPAQVTFVGHDDSAWFPAARAKDRAPRSWFVSSDAPNNAYRFAFSGVNVVEGSRVKLLHRPDAASAWQMIAVSNGPATFDVPLLQRGYYTVEVTASGLCISIR